MLVLAVFQNALVGMSVHECPRELEATLLRTFLGSGGSRVVGRAIKVHGTSSKEVQRATMLLAARANVHEIPHTLINIPPGMSEHMCVFSD